MSNMTTIFSLNKNDRSISNLDVVF